MVLLYFTNEKETVAVTFLQLLSNQATMSSVKKFFAKESKSIEKALHRGIAEHRKWHPKSRKETIEKIYAVEPLNPKAKVLLQEGYNG